METLTTTIEWHLAEKELPEKSGEYLVVTPVGTVTDIYFSKKHSRFNFRDWMGEKEKKEFGEYSVVYWAEVPSCFFYDNLAKYREE